MLVNDFSTEMVMVDGFPKQTFTKRYRNLWDMFSESADVNQETVYLLEGQNRITFGQAREMATRLAGHLREQAGVERGDHIGILMENSIRFVISFWAVQCLGATAVIFNTRLATPELMRQLQFSDLKALLTSSVLSAKVKEIPAGEL